MKRKKSIGRLRRAIEKLKRAIKEWREAKRAARPSGLRPA